MNDRLTSIPTKEEIKTALFSINAKKAPGPDGFSASFFQSFWNTLGDDLAKEIQCFFREGKFPENQNKTFDPERNYPKESFRLSAYCTLLYYK